jgi:hypothetical protein
VLNDLININDVIPHGNPIFICLEASYDMFTVVDLERKNRENIYEFGL